MRISCACLLVGLLGLCSCTSPRQSDAVSPSRLPPQGHEMLHWAQVHIRPWAARYGVGGTFLLVVPDGTSLLHSVARVPGLDAGFHVVALEWQRLADGSGGIAFRFLDEDAGSTPMGFWPVARQADGGMIDLANGATVDTF